MAMLIISYLTWCESLLILPRLKDQKLRATARIHKSCSILQSFTTFSNPARSIQHYMKPSPSLARELFCFAHESHLATPARKKITRSLKIPTVWHFDQRCEDNQGVLVLLLLQKTLVNFLFLCPFDVCVDDAHSKLKGDELFLSADHVGRCFFGLERVVVGTDV